MGDIHDMEKTMTAGQLADKLGLSPDTMRKRIVRKGLSESYSADMVLSAQEVRILSGKQKAAVRTKQTPPTTQEVRPEPKSPAASWRFPSFTLQHFLSAVIYGHTALVWYEVSAIFSTPGFIAGVILAAMKHAALTVCKDTKTSSMQDGVIAAVFFLDTLSWWAHWQAFREAMPVRFLDQVGQSGVLWASGILAAVVSVCAFLSLRWIAAITNSKIFEP